MTPAEEDDTNFRLKEPSSVEKLLEIWETLKTPWAFLEDLEWWLQRSTNTIQEYNQKRSHGLDTLFKFKKTSTGGPWEIGCIMELIKSRDEEERAAKVLLPSRNTMQRSLCPFLPLECDQRLDNSDETGRVKELRLKKVTWRANVKIVSIREDKQRRRPETRSVDNIWRKIDKWTSITTKLFPLLRECCEWSRSMLTFREYSTNRKKLLTYSKLITS